MSEAYLPDIHRLLPQSSEAERGVLSSFFLSPQEVGDLYAEKQVRAEHFHLPAHALIFTCMMEMKDEGKAIDILTVTQRLRDRNQLDQAGGGALISELLTYLPTAANAEHYLQTLVEKYTLRSIISVCTEYASRAYDEQRDPQGLLDAVEARVLAIRGDDDSEAREASTKELVMEVIQEIEESYENRGKLSGLETGFAELDLMLDGLHPKELILIAARPSMGKSAIGMDIAAHVVLKKKLGVIFFTLEMSDKQLIKRALLSEARVNHARIRGGYVEDRDFPALTAAASRIAASKLRVVDANGTSIQTLRAKARRLKRKYPNTALIVVDYLQQLTSHSQQARSSREREVSEISAGCKSIAKELNIPVVVLAQLNRDVEKRSGEAKGRPRMSDLRESGAIEQDADVIGLLYREEYYAVTEEQKLELEGKATLIIAKNRNGPVGDIHLTFLKEFTHFENGEAVAPPVWER